MILLALIQLAVAWAQTSYSLRINGKMAVIGSTTYMWKVLRLPMEYEDMGAYHEGVAPAKRDGLWGYVDLAGNWAIPPKYEAAEAFVNGYAAVRLEGKVGIVTRADEVAAPFAYEEAGYVYRGMFPAKVGGKWGVFGLDGETKLPPEYACIEWIDIRDPRVPTRFHGHFDLGWGWE